MICLRGKGVSVGYAIGTLRFHNREEKPNSGVEKSTPDEEQRRFDSACTQAVSDLTALAEKLRRQGEETAALLMEMHGELAQDLDFADGVAMRIADGTDAPTAVRDAGEELAMLFEAMDDADMQQRSADVRDVARRIENILLGKTEVLSFSDPVILGADDLSPSETVSLEREKLLAILTVGGSGTGHTAILARSFGIPAVVGIGNGLTGALENRLVIVDGFEGTVLVEPDETTLAEYRQRMDAYAQSLSRLNGLRGLPDETADGRKVKLYCNIQSPEDVGAVRDNDGRGIGLFRSEFLFLGREEAPDEEEQTEAYRRVLSAMKGQEVVIRTLDVGADKQIPYFSLPGEENPALGLRGLRLCLKNPALFRTQLRALYRASVYGKLLIMFPMVTNSWEITATKELCQTVVSELKAEGYPVAEKVPLGIMIETPAAALMSDVLARQVDFFSCGTNDLTQYTLACDRMGEHLRDFCDPHHPAVLRLLELTVKNAHEAGIWVGVCGELAADTAMTETLIAMGVDELSVNPGSVLPVREQIRQIKQ